MHYSETPLQKFLATGELAAATTQLLALSLSAHTRAAPTSDRVAQKILTQSRDYVSHVREGFKLSVRTQNVHDPAELAWLLEQVILDWEHLADALGLSDMATTDDDWNPLQSRAEAQHYLLAYGMAVVALGMLPRLPESEIHWPERRYRRLSYADIPVPDSPGALLHRIEEMERMLWQLMATEDVQALFEHSYGALRRTFGFFESSAWLVRRESRRFGRLSR